MIMALVYIMVYLDTLLVIQILYLFTFFCTIIELLLNYWVINKLATLLFELRFEPFVMSDTQLRVNAVVLIFL